ncbi:MAG: DoxX family protein [Chloroflexi bacterium]|nr:DoxX family protein [Chloroflexota bacterium]
MRRTSRSEPAADNREWGERPFQVAVLGREFTFAFHEVVVGFTLLLRLLMGWIFLWAGFDKAVNGFTAEGFLLHATSGPLQGWFVDLGGNAAALSVIDPLVTYGQILMGFALVLGAGTRLTLVFAAIMMFLFYLAQFPPEHDLFVDYYLVYIVVYLMLGALGAGRILGVDRYLEQLPWLRAHAWARYLLG